MRPSFPFPFYEVSFYLVPSIENFYPFIKSTVVHVCARLKGLSMTEITRCTM